jgi:hypothetical protein
MPRQMPSERHKAAEMLAIQGLSFLAAEPERLGRFLALTGIGPGEVRAMAQRPEFLAAVLDHLSSDETLLVQFAQESGRNPMDIGRARATLSGPDWEHDTA